MAAWRAARGWADRRLRPALLQQQLRTAATTDPRVEPPWGPVPRPPTDSSRASPPASPPRSRRARPPEVPPLAQPSPPRVACSAAGAGRRRRGASWAARGHARGSGGRRGGRRRSMGIVRRRGCYSNPGALTGFSKPTSGTAYIEGMNIRFDMNRIYARLGVCPQHDLLWEELTGREHLMFYGRLKKLKGAALTEAIEQSLRSMHLHAGGVADKLVGKYSGGMKRRLSVAISLIGDPKVVYMDEPSSGLDPKSRKDLWKVLKSAKQDRAIILTTHSMEEAEVLCDRIGIIANGSLQCIGTSKELKDRYGGSCVLTVTSAAGVEEEEVERVVQSISPAAKRVYRISGTQKFEMPKQGMKIPEVFEAMEQAKSRLNILAWGLSDTTLEDVFIRVAKDSDTAT